MPALSNERKKLAGVMLLCLPFTFFLALQIFPAWDIAIWNQSWNVRLLHYYFVSFATITSLIVAIFIGIAAGSNINGRSLFMTLGFAGIAALLLLRSLSTPGIFTPMETNEIFHWSLPLGLFAGAILFTLASMPWSTAKEAALIRQRRPIAFSLTFIFIIFVLSVWNFPAWLAVLRDIVWLESVMAITAIVLYLGSAGYHWKRTWSKQTRFNQLFNISLVLFAEAQIFAAFGPDGSLSWFIAPITLVFALLLMLYAIILQFRHANTLRPAHYFGALGSIVIFSVAIFVGELGVRWFIESIRRSNLLTMALIQGGVSFFVLYFIVYRLDKLIQNRTNELKREQRLRSELTQLIIHDLKSPLTVLTSGLNLLSRKKFIESQESQKQLISQLENAGGNIINMINDLLDVERMEAGKLKINRRSVDINKLLAERIQDFRLTAETNNQTLTLYPVDANPIMSLDKRLLERLFDNLLSNAMKFTPDQGQIDVRTMLTATDFLVAIEDTGSGVPLEERERIFEKFGQVKGTERRGAGLGLSFCRMVARIHNGDLTVMDSTLGGARFQLSLPLTIQNEDSAMNDALLIPTELDSSKLTA